MGSFSNAFHIVRSEQFSIQIQMRHDEFQIKSKMHSNERWFEVLGNRRKRAAHKIIDDDSISALLSSLNV